MAKRRRDRQTSLDFASHGGARCGSGRKPKGRVASVTHLPRPHLSGREPVLVTLKFESSLPSARSQFAFRLILRSLTCARDRFGMRVVEYSVQGDHIHLVVEAASAAALTRATQGLAVRLARGLNRRLKRRGKVFKERYHGRVLETPRQVRNALAYVLCNGRKHGHAPLGASGHGWLDPFSSARSFDGWKGRIGDGDRDGATSAPRTWLLRIGWRRAGLLSTAHAPGATPV
jgi:REP element-mobilizing transposase RayT